MSKSAEMMRSELLELRNKKNWDNKEWGRATGIPKQFWDELEAGRIELEEEDYKTLKKKTREGKSELLRFKKPIIIGTWIHKGGTGKTTVISNLIYELTVRGYDVLAIDADSQADLSSVLYPNYLDTPECNFFDCFILHDNFKEHTCKTEYDHLHIVPGTAKSGDLDITIAPLPNETRRRIFSMCLREIITENFYDFIVIDMDKMAGVANKSMLEITDYLLTVVEPAMFASKAVIPIDQLMRIVKETNPKLELLGVILNKVDLRKKEAIEDTIQVVDRFFPGGRFENYMSTDGNLDRSQKVHVPIQVYKNSCKASKQIRAITTEMLERISTITQLQK